MLNQQQLAALLIKVAVSASLASIVMRFGRFQRMLLRSERTLEERLHLALIFALVFGASAGVRILSHQQYTAVDLAFEGAVIAGALGGYVSGLLTGILVALPDMYALEFMSLPLFAAAGLIGALIHDLAPRREDIWHFSPFVDLNLYRLLRQVLRLNRNAIQPRVVELAAFNVACNALVVVAEMLRWGVQLLGFHYGTFSLFDGKQLHNPWIFLISAATTLFAVTLPIWIWGSFRNERQLESQHAHLVEARLAALTNQINPHFLFNTLNSIATLIRINPESARDMIYRLSKILRRLLRKAENFSPLREEISFIDDYLAIEMVRFGEKLRFEKEIDSRTLDWPIPSMILQPIVENSIKHGLASKIEGGTVRIKTWLEGGKLNILIEDDGVGIQESKLDQLFESGIGVSNVNERLRVLFGPRYRMVIESRPGEGTQTMLEIPDREEPPQVLSGEIFDQALRAASRPFKTPRI
jgi:two-component system LytT family sensor kinase